MAGEAKRYFIENLDRKRWDLLLDFARENADEFRAAVKRPFRSCPSLEKGLPSFLAELSGRLSDAFTSRERWHSRQLFTTDFYVFRLDRAVWEYIGKIGELERWSEDEGRPEDPSFLRKGMPVIETISHEGYAYIMVDDAEALRLRQQGFALAPAGDAV